MIEGSFVQMRCLAISGPMELVIQRGRRRQMRIPIENLGLSGDVSGGEF